MQGICFKITISNVNILFPAFLPFLEVFVTFTKSGCFITSKNETKLKKDPKRVIISCNNISQHSNEI